MSQSRDSRQKTGRWSPRATPQPQPRAAKPEAELLASPSDHSARKHSSQSAADPGRRGPDREVSGHCHARGPARTRPTARAGEGGCGRLGPPSLPRASLCLPAALPHAAPLAGCKSAPFAAVCSPVTCSVLLPGPHPRPPVIAPPTGRAGAYIQTTPRALCPASHSGLTPRGRPVRPHPVSVLSAFPAQRGPVWSHPCSSERIITASFPLGPLLQTAPPIHLHKT